MDSNKLPFEKYYIDKPKEFNKEFHIYSIRIQRWWKKIYYQQQIILKLSAKIIQTIWRGYNAKKIFIFHIIDNLNYKLLKQYIINKNLYKLFSVHNKKGKLPSFIQDYCIIPID